ncbi:hypothetical protein M316_0134 [Nitrincola phage 1M3-16]|uniref:PhoH-like phosphate starvation-inducible n=1 Tax=Nitrincola phage 1M3-16 TaxID=1472912 RepID=UPI000444CDE1|nr:PhoH-like phosphate starvation-inducible [Nitrincola phage 1M3-16]AHX01199.1 hypothetical protein M316_0134 [Nitrincola phage 1M3-16]
MKKVNRRRVQEATPKKSKKFDTEGETPTVQQELGNRKRFHSKDVIDISPMNDRQREFIRLFHEGHELLVAAGSGGTGKSFLAMYCALSEVVRSDSVYDKIILVRSSVQTRDLGFIGGNEEKFSFFESPYHPLCHSLMPQYKNAYEYLKALGYLEFHLTSFIRGNTFDNCIIIFDEFQSANYHEISSVITRCGENSRIILCGDSKQDDLLSKGRKNDQSGFGKLMNVVDKMPPSMVGVVQFGLEDIVRSGLVREFLIADHYTS